MNSSRDHHAIRRTWAGGPWPSTPSGSPPAGTARALREQPPADSNHCKAIDRRHCAPSSQKAPAVELPRICDVGVRRTQSIGRRTRPRTEDRCVRRDSTRGATSGAGAAPENNAGGASTAVDASRSSFLGWACGPVPSIEEATDTRSTRRPWTTMLPSPRTSGVAARSRK